MQILQRLILAKGKLGAAIFQQMCELRKRWVGWRTAMPRNRERPARICETGTGGQRLITQPTAQKPRHETVTSAKRVVNLNFPDWDADTTVPSTDVSCEHSASKCPAFADKNSSAKSPTCAQASKRVSCPAGNVPFFLGSNNQITMWQNGLQMSRDGLACRKPALAISMTTERPQIGPIIDVKTDPATIVAGKFHRLETRIGNTLSAEMRPRYKNGTRRGNEILIDVVLAYRHIGAIFTIENQRKLLSISDTQQHQSGQSLGVGNHIGCVNALSLKLLSNKAAHMLITNTGDQRRLQTKTGATDADVGWASTNIFGKTCHILKSATDLRAIKINR